MRKKLLAGVAACTVAGSLAVASPASAAVTYDRESGTGFVGKGDVQQALGWNNRQLQANASRIDFNVETNYLARWRWTCTKEGSKESRQVESIRTHTQVGWLTTTPRVRQQVVGFELSDYEYIVGISNPVKGPELNECPASWTANGLKQVGTMKERFRLSVLLDGEQVAHLE